MSYTEKIQSAFNGFNGRNLEFLESFYSPRVVFQDPVTRISGLGKLKRYYAHAYQNVKAIHFEFDDFIVDGNKVGASWVMRLAVRGLNHGAEFAVEGFSQFTFDEEGKVTVHRDYVDLGAMIYERLPVLGAGIRLIKRKLGGWEN